MRHDINRTGCGLLLWHCKRVCWIHESTAGPHPGAVKIIFVLRLWIRNYCSAVHFGTSRCNCQHNENGESFRNLTLIKNKIPSVTRITGSCSNCFRTVYCASSTNCKNYIYIIFFANLCTFSNRSDSGIRINTTKFNIFDPTILEYSCYLFIDTIFKNTSSTIHHEHTIPIAVDVLRNITGSLATEKDVRVEI